MKRIQNLPPILFTVTWKNIEDKNVYFWYYQKKKEIPCRNTCTTIEEAIQKLTRAETAGYEAYVSCFVPANKQHGVIAITSNGRLRSIFTSGLYKDIENAYKSVIETTITVPSKKEMTVQKIVAKPVNDKNDPCKMVVKVHYEGSKKQYSFRCGQFHFPNEKVCVYTGTPKEYKNVTVDECIIMHDSEIIELANKFGYKDLEEVYCDKEIIL